MPDLSYGGILKSASAFSPERVAAVEHYTVDEYLSFERASQDVKHEYLDGLILAMAGASREHNLITTNIVRRFGNQLQGSACETYSSDMRVKTTPMRYTVDGELLKGETDSHAEWATCIAIRYAGTP